MKKVLFFISALFFFASCEGPEGPAGADGVDGNANVRVGVVNNISWDDTGYPVFAEFSWDAITQDIIDNGVVLGFWQFTSQSGMTLESPLPYMDANSGGWVEQVIPYYTSYSNNDNIVLMNYSDDGIPTIYGNIGAVKFVAIEGTGKRDYSDWTWEDVLTYYPDIEIEEIK
jgi:hypothetical protein